VLHRLLVALERRQQHSSPVRAGVVVGELGAGEICVNEIWELFRLFWECLVLQGYLEQVFGVRVQHRRLAEHRQGGEEAVGSAVQN
jgi:hypothetical protein